MNKNGLINVKYKVKFDLTHSINSLKSVSARLAFKENHFIIRIDDSDKLPNKTLKKDAVITAISPIYSEEYEIYISYGLIYKITNKNIMIRLEVFHPSYQALTQLEIYDFTEPGILRDKKIGQDGIVNIENFLQNKKIQISKYLIETLVLFFNCLKDGVNHENIVSNLEEKYYKSISVSKKYYTTALSDLKKSDKVKADLKKKIISSSKSSNSATSTNQNTQYTVTVSRPSNTNNNFETSNIVETICNDKKNVNYLSFESLFYEIKKKSIQSLETTIFLFFQILGLDIYSINLKKVPMKSVSKNLKMIDHEEGVSPFKNSKKNLSEVRFYENQLSQKDLEIDPAKSMEDRKFKLRSNSNKMLSNNDNLKNFINDDYFYSNYEDNKEEANEHKNKNEGNIVLMTLEEANENNFDTLLKTHEKFKGKSGGDTPKFKEKGGKRKKTNEEKNRVMTEIELNNATIMELNRKIEETKKNHLFLPPNDYLNIIHNTSELCHRKFFEFCFEDYFSKIFKIDKDNYGVIKIDSIVSYFYFIKGLKNFLFTDENKIFYANLFFYDDL